MSDTPALPRKKLLLVAYDFPPIASAGSHRITSMAKYLLARNWAITLVTVRSSFVHKSSESMEYVPQDVRLERTRCFEFAQVMSWISGASKGQTSIDKAEAEARAGGDGGGELGAAAAPKWWARPLVWIDRVLAFPDRKVGWFFPLLFRVWRLLRSERFDVVLSSSPPHSSHLPLLLLRCFMGFKWVVDFRDPWTAPLRESRRGLHLKRFLEKSILERADRVVLNTWGNKDASMQVFPSVAPEKLVVITNGFDSERGGSRAGLESSDLDCELVYTGYVYGPMLNVYLEAVRVISRKPGARIPRLHIFGRYPQHLRIEEELRPYVAYKGRISYQQSLWIMQHANALLYAIPHGHEFESWVPSKLYPYVFSTRPILALIPKGDAATIIRRTNTGEVINETEPAAVASKIASFLDAVAGSSHKFQPKADEVETFAWAALAEKLDATLRELVSRDR